MIKMRKERRLDRHDVDCDSTAMRKRRKTKRRRRGGEEGGGGEDGKTRIRHKR